MAYTPPIGSTSATWQGALPYVGAAPTVTVTWRGGVVAPSGFAGQVGATFVTKQQFIRPAGLVGTFGHIYAERKGAYIPPDHTVAASWVGRAAYLPATGALNAQWNDPFTSERFILGSGFDSSEFGTPQIPQPVSAVGWQSSSFTTPRLYRDDEYVPPYATLNGSWFGATKYELPIAVVNGQWQKLDAPEGLVQTFGTHFEAFGTASIQTAQQALPTSFGGEVFGAAGTKNQRSFVSPNGLSPATWNATNSGSVANSQRFITPGGLSAFGSGTAAVRNWNMSVQGAGGISGAMGQGQVYLYTRYVRPTGLVAGAVAMGAAITNLRQAVLPAGVAPPGIGSPSLQLTLRVIELRTGIAPGDVGTALTYIVVPRYVAPSSIAQAAYGQAAVESTIRYLAPLAIPAGAAGTPTTWFRVRSVAPVGMSTTMPAPTVKDGKQYVLPTGLASFVAGRPTTFRNEAFVSPLGFAGEVGTAGVQLARRTVQMLTSVQSEAYGRATVFNSAQYVRPSWYEESRGAVGVPIDVFNLDRTIVAFGISEPRFAGGAEVLNTARVVTSAAIDSLVFGDALVADRIRTVRVEGFSETFVPPYLWALNKRAFVEPAGITPGRVGVPTLPDRRQPVDAAGGIKQDAFGAALIAPYLRTIDLAFRGIATSLPSPNVALYTRYLRPAGIAAMVGMPIVEEHFNIVVAGGYDLALYGTPAIHNVTPELAAAGWAEAVVSRPGVKNFISFVRTTGIAALPISKPVLAPRIRVVLPNGVDTLRISALNAVTDPAPQPPSRQIVDLTLADEDPPDPAKYGTARLLNMGVIATGFYRGAMGRPVLRTNVVSAVRIANEAAFGEPSLNAQQAVDVPSIEFKRVAAAGSQFTGSEWIGAPRVSPSTVVAASIASPVLGRPSLTNKDRRLQVTVGNEISFGRAQVIGMLRFVAPSAIRPASFGLASVPGDQTLRPYWGTYVPEGAPSIPNDTARYGDADIERAPATNPGTPGDPTPTQYVRPGGMSAPAVVVATTVSNFNREVRPTTINPGLIPPIVVGPPPTAKPVGLASLVFGVVNTGHKIRSVLVDSSELTTQWGLVFDDINGFAPMTVRIKNRPIVVPGLPASAVGGATVSQAQRSVVPAGANSGALGSLMVSGRATVAAEGFDSAVLGTPKRPTPGQVEPAGADETAFGQAILGRGIYVPYIEPGLTGAPRVRAGIRVLGLEGEFGDTVVVGESNCGSKLAVVAQLGDLIEFGQHGVHQ